MIVKQEMKIGPKGQVVIPQLMRESLHLKPGSKVIVELTSQGVLIEKPTLSGLSRKEEEKLMIEGYKATAKRDKRIAREWEAVDLENWPEW